MLVTGTQTNTVAPTGHGARTTTKGRAERTRNWPRHLIPARMVKKPFYRTKRCNDDDTKRHRAYTPVWRELGRVRDSRSTATDTRQQIPTTIVWQIRNQIFQFSGWESQLVNLFKYPQGYLPIHMVRAPLAHPWFLKFTQIQTFTHSSPPDKLFSFFIDQPTILHYCLPPNYKSRSTKPSKSQNERTAVGRKHAIRPYGALDAIVTIYLCCFAVCVILVRRFAVAIIYSPHTWRTASATVLLHPCRTVRNVLPSWFARHFLYLGRVLWAVRHALRACQRCANSARNVNPY